MLVADGDDQEPAEEQEEDAVPAPETIKKKKKTPQRPLSAQEARLWNILRDTNREWTPKEISTAFLKLKAIGIDSVRDLTDMLERGKVVELNERLKAHGKRPFAQKTSKALWSRVVSELPPERFLVCSAMATAALAEAAAGADACGAFASEVAVRAVSSTAGPRWTCESCLWENVSSTFICAACDARRASLAPWQCKICKRENEASALKCKACLETRQRAWAPMRSSICDGRVEASDSEAEGVAVAAQDAEESDRDCTHYELLGVEPGSSLHEISLGYHKQRRLLAQSAGEGGSKQKKLARLREAYKVLTDHAKRRNYDIDHDFEPRPMVWPRQEPRPDVEDVYAAAPPEQQRNFPYPPAKPDFACAGVGAAQPLAYPTTPRKATPSTAMGSPNASSPSVVSPLGLGAQDDVDLYGLLGVKPTASMEQILMAFQEKLAQQGPLASAQRSDQARLELLNTAFDVLTDPAKRQRYDDSRRLPREPQPAKPILVSAAAAPVRAAPVRSSAPPAPAAAAQQKPAEPEDLSAFDLYELLGVAATSGLSEILPAFQRRLTDGEFDGDPQKLALLNKALDVLTDSEKRLKYDAARASRRVAEAKAARAARRAAITARASGTPAAAAEPAAAAPAPAARPAPTAAAPAAAPAGVAEERADDLYDLLGVAATSSLPEILAAFQQRLAVETDARKLGLLQKALDVLTDPAKRREYDATRSAAAPAKPRVVVGRAGAAEAAPAPSSPSRPARSSRAPPGAPDEADAAAPKAPEPPAGQAEVVYSPRSGKPRTRPRVEPGPAPPELSATLSHPSRPAEEAKEQSPPEPGRPQPAEVPPLPKSAVEPRPAGCADEVQPQAEETPAPAPEPQAEAPKPAAEAPAPPPAKGGGTWACEDCSYDNKPDAASCYMCGTARGCGVAVGPPWECPECRYDNPGIETTCGMCGTGRR